MIKMRKVTLLLAAMSAAVLIAMGAALAQTPSQEVLDANTLDLGESATAYAFFPGNDQAQTFTAKNDGKLTRAAVKVHVDDFGGSIDSLKAKITTVDPATGYPTSDALASTTIPATDIPVLPTNVDPSRISLQTLTFDNPATVEAGKRYAIVLSATSSTQQWYVRWTTTSTSYDDGQGMWLCPDGRFCGSLPGGADQVFAVYVTPPADTTPPTVSSTDPNNRATGVSTTAKISAAFSEDVEDLTDSNFKVVSVKTGKSVQGTVEYDSSSKTATFTPTSSLRHGDAYKATITGVKDKAGNTLAKDYTWLFTTAGPKEKVQQ